MSNSKHPNEVTEPSQLEKHKKTNAHERQRKQWLGGGAIHKEYDDHVVEELEYEFLDGTEKEWLDSDYKPDREYIKILAQECREMIEDNVLYFKNLIPLMENACADEIQEITSSYKFSEEEKFEERYLTSGRWKERIDEVEKSLARFRIHLPRDQKTSHEVVQQETLERAREASLVEIAQQYMKLTKLGDKWRGLCPFHDEKTASFNVYNDHFHCYGCQAHGDVITFKMDMDNITFSDAVRELGQ